MIGLILLPFFIVFNILLNIYIIKWLSLFTKVSYNSYTKYVILSIQIILTFLLGISLLIPNSNIKRMFNIVGNYYLGLLIYAIFVMIVLFIIHLFFKNISRNKLIIIGFISIILVVGINIYGVVNSDIIHTTRYTVNINKKSSIDSLKIVMVADLHLGYNKGYEMVKNMVDKINKEKPDVVVIAGDIFDNNYDALDNPEAMIKELKKIKTKYGVYSVYGNHDIKEKVLFGFTFGNNKESDSRMDYFLKKSNIKLLKDDYVMIKNSIYLYGRPDYRKSINRKSAKEVANQMDKSKPIIVIDHQPKELSKLASNGVDLDLSGHTHDGQIFPLNLFIKLVYKNSYGIKKFGNMNSIVTSGVGLYGPNLRVFTKAEITSITVNFN